MNLRGFFPEFAISPLPTIRHKRVAFVLKHNVDEKNLQNIDGRIHVKLELQEMRC